MITRKDVDSLFGEYKDHIKFIMGVPWNETSIDQLNDYVEDYVEDGHLLCDISYSLVGCNIDTQEVMVHVFVSDMDENTHPDNYMDDDIE